MIGSSMLEIQGKIHDRYTLEFKVGYSRHSPTAVVSEFLMDTWIFIPNSLYINSKTYPKSNFYRDFRALVRLITPVYSLEEIADEQALPQARMSECCAAYAANPTEENERAYEHQVKMFGSITRSALRSAAARLCTLTDAEQFRTGLERLTGLIRKITEAYRGIPERAGLSAATDGGRCSFFAMGEEYLCRTIDTHLFRIMSYARQVFAERFRDVTSSAAAYVDEDVVRQKQRGFILPLSGNKEHNKDFLHHASLLKKFIESDLYIVAVKKSNTFILQQIFFMLAAGLSMVFATVISFSFQQTYGNFTMPLFIALVVSYMFKDRFKDLMHSWFANKLGSKFYDYKIKLALRGTPVGWGKEGCDFVNEDKLPVPVRVRRGSFPEGNYEQKTNQEAVIVYRRRISIYSKRLKQLSHYPLYGLNDIIRVNLREFLRRMDSPHAPVYLNKGGGDFEIETAERAYYLHFVMRYRYLGIVGYKRFRVCLTRQGVKGLTEL